MTTAGDDVTLDDVTLDALTAGVSLFQRRKGHRFSSDDVVTAWVAMQACPAPATALDLGCGIGSVLLHVAWSAPAARLTGVEVQDVSFALLQRNVAHNDLAGHVTVHHGDLRDPDVIAALGGPFELVTGTPPYFPVDTASAAADRQRTLARIEERGGIEAYVHTAATVIDPSGWLVVCGDADARGRAEQAAGDDGFVIVDELAVIPRAGRPPLFAVWTMRRPAAAAGATTARRTITLRDAAGERTADARALRAFSGFPEKADTVRP